MRELHYTCIPFEQHLRELHIPGPKTRYWVSGPNVYTN